MGKSPMEFWQELIGADRSQTAPPYRDRYHARLPDGRFLMQPLRQLPGDPDSAVASLISTQISFEVERALSQFLADAVRDLRPEVIVGVPTLGMIFARNVAELLGFANWVALGYSRKFWYDDALSEPVRSITSPEQAKRLYLDPRMLPRLQGRRVLLIDDVISSGASAAAALALLARAGHRPVAFGCVMLQGDRWRSRLGDMTLRGVFATPLFRRTAEGWWPRQETLIEEAVLS
jgi:adenine/guanine phosphoribosyltransferase-like PRPP-binding protein